MNMDRAIFDLKASVEATSLYILICAFLDQGEPPTLPLIRTKWTGTEENLQQAIDELVQLGVLEEARRNYEDTPLSVTPSSKWRTLH